MASIMFSTIMVREWSPILIALEYPQYFYPILIGTFLLAAVAWWFFPHYSASKTYPNKPAKREAAESTFRNDLSIFYGGAVVVFGVIGGVIQFGAGIVRDHEQAVSTLAATNVKNFNQARCSARMAFIGARS
jgi:hypothetical protein